MPIEWLALAGAFSSAVAHLALKKAVGAASPSLLLAARWGVAAAAMTGILLAGPGWAGFQPSWSLALLMLGAVLGPVVAWSFYLRALARLDVSVAQPIFNSAVVVTMLLAVVFLGERPNGFTLVGAGLILVGVQLLQGIGGPAEPVKRAWWKSRPRLLEPAILLVLAGAVGLGAASFLFKIGLGELTVLQTNWVRTATPALVLLAMNLIGEARLLATGGPPPLRITWRGLALAAVAALGNDVFGWLLRLTALKDGALVVVEPLASTSPLFVALLSTLLLGERLGRRGWTGVGATVAGAALLGGWGR